jgi:GT2 family glycosyltransferase
LDATDAKLIVIVLAHFRHCESMRAFLAHVRTQRVPAGYRLKILVHDNSGDFDKADAQGLSITVYSTGDNLHYLGGCWRAIREWMTETGAWPEWTIVANHDLVFDAEFLTTLVRLPTADDVGVVAPAVRLRNGVAQNPFLWGRPSRAAMWARAVALRFSTIYRIMEARYRLRVSLAARRHRSSRRGDTRDGGNADRAVPIYAPHGCVMLIHRRFFERGGSLASKNTAFHEEFLVAERCRRLGLKVVWIPSLHVVHYENTTMRLVPRTSQRRWMRQLSSGLLKIYDDGEGDTWSAGQPGPRT